MPAGTADRRRRVLPFPAAAQGPDDGGRPAVALPWLMYQVWALWHRVCTPRSAGLAPPLISSAACCLHRHRVRAVPFVLTRCSPFIQAVTPPAWPRRRTSRPMSKPSWPVQSPSAWPSRCRSSVVLLARMGLVSMEQLRNSAATSSCWRSCAAVITPPTWSQLALAIPMPAVRRRHPAARLFIKHTQAPSEETTTQQG